MNEYEKIKNANRLRTTTQDLLHLMKDKVMVHFVENQLQKTETDRYLWNIPTLFLCKFIQSSRKQSNNKRQNPYKKSH